MTSANADEQATIGFLEHLEPTALHGWALRPDDKPIHVALRVDDRLYPLAVAWVERPDVAQQHGTQYLISGFRSALPTEVAVAVKGALRASLAVEVLADGVVLPCLAKMPTAADLLMTESLQLSVRTDHINSVIESWGHFTLYGRAVMGEQLSEAYTLHCNGATLDCVVQSSKRHDVAQALGIEIFDAGFEIELPGYLWEAVPETEDAHLEIRAGGEILTTEPLSLSRSKAARWVTEICNMCEGQEKQYRALLALEHVHYGKLNALLDAESRAVLNDFSARMHLGEFLSSDDKQVGLVLAQIPENSPAQLQLWRALRQLNSLLAETTGSILPNVKVVLDEQALVGEVRESFLRATVPLLCKSGEFNALLELLDISRLKRLEASNDLWEMSLALPACVADGDVQGAADLILRMSQHLDCGWLNTECVRFALGETLRLEAEGTIETEVAERLRNYVIGLLDGFRGEWFSRLHDQELIDAMLILLAHLVNYSDNHRRGVIAAAIRIYGLNPTFWSRLALQGIASSGELLRARRAWASISAALTDTVTSFNERLPIILDSLAYFQRQHNPEAIVFLREVFAHALPVLSRDLILAEQKLVERLLEQNPLEAMRIAAAPFNGNNLLVKHFPEIIRELPDILRRHIDHSHSKVFHLQEEAADLLKLCCGHDAKVKGSELPALLDQLEEKAVLLGNLSGSYLGAELLAQVYRIARLAGLPQQNHALMHLGEIIYKAIEQTSPNGYLPIPVHTALAHLEGMEKNTSLSDLLQEVRVKVQRKFGDRHDELLESAAEAGGREFSNQGWPSDTLVVIYSCRKYLDSRVAAIRATWGQDLKARGIPYVVLVGDGDDTLRGDLLALDVSDLYEDLPKKTLKLFDWGYRHTGAQFILKIDDDCYLDVARYFDSMSYRKYPYYGRTLRCQEGNMDRLWHQPKSHGVYSQKTIDKSPEPSIYADGGGAYCLSRLAMRKLLDMEKTDAGKRLMGCSFMEDKLVGDLLSLAGIQPSDEDYESYQRRRTFGNAMPVGMAENTFFPGAVTPTKVVHLDIESDLTKTYQRCHGNSLWPKKIWPTNCSPSINHNSNQLELLTSPESAASLLKESLLVVVVVRNEIIMLPHFLAHYRAMGVKTFIVVDNLSNDGTREYLFQQPDVVLYSSDTEYKHSHYGVAWQQAILANHCLGKWVLLADADELLVFPGCEAMPLAKKVQEIEAGGFDAACVYMVDMYPFSDLAEADFAHDTPFSAAPWFDARPIMEWRMGSGYYSNATNYVSALRHRLIPGAEPNAFTAQKFSLLRYAPWHRLCEGLHNASNINPTHEPLYFAHFKYHSGFKKKVEIEVRRKQHFDNAKEYRNYLSMLTEGSGDFGSENTSLRYQDSWSFKQLMH